MPRSYDGDIFVTVGANTDPADKKIDALFDKIETLQHIDIDANISTIQRKLTTMAKRTNEQMSSNIVKSMLKDFKTVLGAMKSEYERSGMDTVIYKSLDQTVKAIESRFANLSVSIGTKQVAGLEKILNSISDLEAISDFKFEEIISQRDVQNSAAVVKNVKEMKKEIDSLAGRIDYIGKALKKNVDSALSDKKLKEFEKRILGIQDELKAFSSVDNPLIQAALEKTADKAIEVLTQVQIKYDEVARKQTETTHGLAEANIELGSAVEAAAKKTESATKKMEKALDKAVKKYNEIMEAIGHTQKTIGTPFSKGTDNWGLAEMLNEVKQIFDTYYEEGHKNQNLKSSNYQMWKSQTTSLGGFLRNYAKYYDGSAEAIYNKVQKKKEELASYETPKWDPSIASDNEKYLAFKQKELDYETKRLQIMKELVKLEAKYQTSPLFAWKERPSLDKEGDIIDVIGLSSSIKDYEEGLAYTRRAVERIAQDIETKRRIANPQYTPITQDGKKTAWGSTDDPKKAYEYIRNQNWGISNIKRLDLNSMAQESPDEASRKYLETRREIADILNKEKLEYQDIIKLLEIYNQKCYQTLTQSKYIADAINMAADIETKIGRGTDFAYDNYLTTALNSLNEPGKLMSNYIEMYANVIAKKLGVVEQMTTNSVEDITSMLNRLHKITGHNLKEYLDMVKRGVEMSKDAKEILTALKLIDDFGNFIGKRVTDGLNNHGVIMNDTHAIIQRDPDYYEMYDNREDWQFGLKENETYLDRLIAKMEIAEQRGVSLAKVLAFIQASGSYSNMGYDVQELAPGQSMHIVSNENANKNIDNFEKECDRIVNAKAEHIQKLMKDAVILNDLGFDIDFGAGNVLYDTEKGFTFIDLALRELNVTARTTTQLMESLFRCLSGFGVYQDIIAGFTDPSNVAEYARYVTAMESVFKRLNSIFANYPHANLNDVNHDPYALLSDFHNKVGSQIDIGFTPTASISDAISNIVDDDMLLDLSDDILLEDFEIPITVTPVVEHGALQNEVVEDVDGSIEVPVTPVIEDKELSKLLMGSSGITFAGKQPINFKYAVVSADDLVVSHDAYGNVNSNYPSELQPRDRTRVMSTAQILGMVNKIVPELLTHSPTAQNGSPIVSSNGTVIGGNARSIALAEAYRTGHADGYSTYIAEHASEFGLNAANFPKNPVLVRVVDDESDLGQLAKHLNASTTAGYSTTEQAMINEELVMKVISKLNLDESANLNAEANKDFIHSFVNLLSDSQRNEMVTSDGSLSAIGLVKVKQAIMSAAYGSKEMLENLEQINPELANISNALMTVAAKAADVRYAIETGGLNDLGVISTVLNGVGLLKASKHAGYANIEEYLGQQSMFGSAYSAEDIAIGKFIESNIRSATQIGNMLNILFDSARNAGDPMQVSFDVLKDASLEDIVKSSFAQYAQKYNKNIDYDSLVSGHLPAESGSRSDKRIERTSSVEDAGQLAQQEKDFLDTAEKAVDVIEEQGDAIAAARKEQEQFNNEVKKQKSSGGKKKEKELIEPILKIAEESHDMIGLISSAAGKDAAMKFLSGITSETDLQDRVANYFNDVFGGDDWKFREKGAYTLVGDTITTNLINSSQDALSAVFRLKDGVLELQEDSVRFSKANIAPFNVTEAINDATEKFDEFKKSLGDYTYDGLSKLEESFEAITDADSFKAFNNQLKLSQKEIKKIADDTKWIIEQNKQLDSKVRSYQYGSKQLNGTTRLEDPDATSMEDGANRTIDGLVDHIRTRLKNVAAGTLTDSIKNIIRDDMRILENEIKVGQLAKYTSTTMSASEAEAARKALINQLDTLKAQAEKENVFDVISESYDKLRARLTDDKNAEYITNNFSDAVNGIRVIRSAKNKVVAESNLEKQEQQHLETLLRLQERLYESKKKYVTLESGNASQSDLMAAERKTDELQKQYDTSISLLKSAEDYHAVMQRELQLEDELRIVQQEALDAENARIIAAEEAAEIARDKQTKVEVDSYDKELLEIQKKQKENFEELIRLREKYNEADYNWHKAELSGKDKEPYNMEMFSTMQDMRAILAETELTVAQVAEINRIDNEHLQRKNQLLNDAAAARKKNLEELGTLSRWESDIKNVGMLSDETVQRINNLKDAISRIDDDTDVGKLVEEFKALKDEVKYETTQSKSTKTRMAEIKASLNAQKQELKALYGELDLDMPLGDNAPSAKSIQDSYLSAIQAIEKCTNAIGEQTQEEIANAAASANAAKIKMNAYKEMQDQYEAAKIVEEQRTGDGTIKQYYQTLNSTIKQIASLDLKMNNLKLKDDGSGVWAPIISSLEAQREQLLDKVRDTAYKINDAFSDGFVQGENKIELPFSSILQSLGDEGASGVIQNFFNDIRVQEALTEQSIESFVLNIQNAQNKAEEFAISLGEKLSVVAKSAKTLSDLGRSGAISTDHELYKGGLDRLTNFAQYKSTLPSDPTSWSAEQTITIQKLANEVEEYVSALDKAVSTEAKYFASKKQYANIANMQDYTDMASNMDKMSSSTNRARQDLEKFVDGFTDGKGIITGFTTSADGISKINFSVLEDGTGYLRSFSAEMGQFTNNVYTMETSMGNMTAGTTAAEKALSSMSQVMSRLNSYGMTSDNNEYVGDLYTKMQTLSGKLKELGTSKDMGDQNTLKNMAIEAERLLKKITALEQAYLKMNDAVADGNAQKVGNIATGEDPYEKMVQFAKEMVVTMPGATLEVGKFNEKTNQLPYVIETADGEVKTFIMTMDKLGGVVTSEVVKVEKAKTVWQQFGASFGGLGKAIEGYAKRMLSVWSVVRYLRQGFKEVLEIDTAMTELKKVTDETSVAYKNFLDSAYVSAKKLGSTMKEFTQATADFARLGYSLEDASMLAEAANVYMNVGDGIDDVGQASESIISTMKAFNIEAEDSMGIVDRFNEVGNNFAIDSVGIGEALQRSASALAEAGNTIDESIALVTGANTVVQNPEQVGTALKTLALRLRGAKVELEEAGLETENMAESTSTLQAKLKALTHGKVDIMLDPETFKSTTQILREMADAWEHMTDIERASALELMGGKRQAKYCLNVQRCA